MRRRIFPKILIVLVIALIGVGAYTFFKDMDGPTVSISPDTGKVSPNTILQVSMEDESGIRELTVGVRKNNTFVPFYRKYYDTPRTQHTEQVPMQNANLPSGVFELEIQASDASLAGFGSGNTRTKLYEMRLDAQPPRLSMMSTPGNVWRGGSGIVRFKADEDVTNVGVMIAGYFVPATQLQDSSYVCIYPFPFTMGALDFKRNVTLTATDLAGNVTQTPFTFRAYERRYRSDKITISDSFLADVQAKLQHLVPEVTDPLQCYLTINSKIRAQNMETLRQLSLQSAKGKLWEGNFMPLPRAAARANFADRRALFYEGQQVGEAFHLGLDLASVRNAPIPAANNGCVVYTGDLGIYGNVVIIDHGLGVLTVYSHMSEVHVEKGKVVTKGDILGKTGTTGLAFGDHLHFGVVVGGLEVNPIEWLDPKWLTNLTNNLK